VPSNGAENIVSFEIECQIMQVLQGSHVPRFVAAGDLSRLPYLVMEYVTGETLEHWLDGEIPPSVDQIAWLGTAMARALHALHKQNTVQRCEVRSQDLQDCGDLCRWDLHQSPCLAPIQSKPSNTPSMLGGKHNGITANVGGITAQFKNSD
jgi:serine/threonine protein kinase